MKRHRRKIRTWLTSAVFAGWLVQAPAALAVRYAGDDGAVGSRPHTVAGTSQGFDWTNLAILVAVASLLLVAAISITYAARQRRRLAPSH
jgi:hypothetical protein